MESQCESPLCLVEAIAQRFDSLRAGGIDDLQIFLDCAQGFSQSFARSGYDVCEVFATLLAFGLDARSDVAGSVTVQHGVIDKGSRGVAEIMAKVLQLGAKLCIVENKPRVILDHPQRLAGAVAVGVQNSQYLWIHVE